MTAWAVTAPTSALFLSAITVMELELGVLRIEHRGPAQGAILRTWFDDRVLSGFSGRVLPFDTAVALRCARLHVPNPYGERDALIAATAHGHGLTVATRNVADFISAGVEVFNPWDNDGIHNI